MAFNGQQKRQAPFKQALIAILLVLSLVMAVLYSREGEGGVLHTLQGAAHTISTPFQLVGTGIGSVAENVGEQVENATADESTLSALRERNRELTNLLTQAEEYRQRVEQLEDLLDMKNSSSVETVGGSVIGRSTEAWNQTVTINVGEADGVDTGLTVMGPYGVLGQVISTTSNSSVVRLLTDPQSGAAAIIQSSRVEGVVRGSLDGLLYLENVDVDETVNVGDVVLTSGMGGSYTSGLLIGTVVKVDGAAGDATRRIVVSPNNGTEAIEEVLVVLSSAGDSNTQGGSR